MGEITKFTECRCLLKLMSFNFFSFLNKIQKINFKQNVISLTVREKGKKEIFPSSCRLRKKCRSKIFSKDFTHNVEENK